MSTSNSIWQNWMFYIFLGMMLFSLLYSSGNYFIGEIYFKEETPENVSRFSAEKHLLASNTSEDYFQAISEYNENQKKEGMVYNRLPKCGGTTAAQLFRMLRPINNFTTYHERQFFKRDISEKDQMEVIEITKSLPKPWLYHRHVHFIDFTKFGQAMPLYINLVRHPVDRFVSRFNFGGYVPTQPGQDINTCVQRREPRCTEVSTVRETLILVPFFCGQQEYCLQPTSRAIQQAKSNVIKYFSVVGILEDFGNFFKALECLLPKYFDGIHSVTIPKSNRAKGKVSIPTQQTRDILEKTLEYDIEFYIFLKERFHKMVDRLKSGEEVPKCHKIFNEQ